MTWWDRTEELWKKNQKFLVLNAKWFFGMLTFNSRAYIITRYNSIFQRIYFFAKCGIAGQIFASHKSQHNRHFLVFVRKLMLIENFGKKLWKTRIFRRVGRLQEIFRRFPCILTKFVILKTSFVGIFRNMHFLCAKKLSSRSSQRRLILNYQGNLTIKFDDNVMKFIL